jgi:hypothetical protein
MHECIVSDRPEQVSQANKGESDLSRGRGASQNLVPALARRLEQGAPNCGLSDSSRPVNDKCAFGPGFQESAPRANFEVSFEKRCTHCLPDAVTAT